MWVISLIGDILYYILKTVTGTVKPNYFSGGGGQNLISKISEDSKSRHYS